MQIKILFDRETVDKKYSIGWGLSCLIDETVLFDTGEQGAFLLHNIEAMNINKDKLEDIVISHDHWDHTGGLWELLRLIPKVKVYSCPNFTQTFKEKISFFNINLIECDNFIEVKENIFLTGEIAGDYNGQKIYEQAIVLRGDKGISVISGCAHPGIVNILNSIKSKFPSEDIYMVIGGFHLMEKERRFIDSIIKKFKDFGIIKAGPTHCSGSETEKLFKEAFGKDFVDVKVGRSIEI